MNLHIAQAPSSMLPVPIDGRYISGIHRTGDALAVAHSNVVSLFPFAGKKSEDRMFKNKICDLIAYPDSLIVTLSVAPDRSVVVAGYSNGGIAVWRHDNCLPACCMEGHFGGASRVLWLDSMHPWGPALLTGGHDGKVHTWAFDADINLDYKFWTPSTKVDGFANTAGEGRVVGKSNFDANANRVPTTDTTGLGHGGGMPIQSNPAAYTGMPTGDGLTGALPDINPNMIPGMPQAGGLTAALPAGMPTGNGLTGALPDFVPQNNTTNDWRMAPQEQQIALRPGMANPGQKVTSALTLKGGDDDEDDDDLLNIF